MVKPGTASNKEMEARRLDASNMLMKRYYRVQVALGLPSCPRNSAYAILDTGPGPNNIKLDAIDPSF